LPPARATKRKDGAPSFVFVDAGAPSFASFAKGG
jgi:hypothetical protein